MIVHVDTSALVSAFAGGRPEIRRVADLLADGHRLTCSTIALYEWLRGPHTAAELEVQQELMPAELVCGFGPHEATLAARLYQSLRRPRSRDLDLAIAACAMVQQATLWTLNRKDFSDIPGLRLL
jgi:predicted nucleic acid-binding protein